MHCHYCSGSEPNERCEQYLFLITAAIGNLEPEEQFWIVSKLWRAEEERQKEEKLV